MKLKKRKLNPDDTIVVLMLVMILPSFDFEEYTGINTVGGGLLPERQIRSSLQFSRTTVTMNYNLPKSK